MQAKILGFSHKNCFCGKNLCIKIFYFFHVLTKNSLVFADFFCWQKSILLTNQQKSTSKSAIGDTLAAYAHTQAQFKILCTASAAHTERTRTHTHCAYQLSRERKSQIGNKHGIFSSQKIFFPQKFFSF